VLAIFAVIDKLAMRGTRNGSDNMKDSEFIDHPSFT
jgi:hypothetical protein